MPLSCSSGQGDLMILWGLSCATSESTNEVCPWQHAAWRSTSLTSVAVAQAGVAAGGGGAGGKEGHRQKQPSLLFIGHRDAAVVEGFLAAPCATNGLNTYTAYGRIDDAIPHMVLTGECQDAPEGVGHPLAAAAVGPCARHLQDACGGAGARAHAGTVVVGSG